jgi:uncharacterized protein (DUF1015 family)
VKINLNRKYLFPNYDCEAYLISFENFDSKVDKMYLHEEITEKIKITENFCIENFEPLIVTFFNEKTSNKDRDDIEIDEFYLLDGHHRWDYAVRSNQLNKLKFILVNNKDVKIESYNFELNTEIKEFESILDANGFVKVISNENSLRFNEQYYSSELYNNKNLLYEFKRKIQTSNLISPVGDKNIPEERMVAFTPVELKDLINLKNLLPPKSTWITPRV